MNLPAQQNNEFELTPEETLLLEKLQQKRLQSLELKVAKILGEIKQANENLRKDITLIQSDFDSTKQNIDTQINTLTTAFIKQTEKVSYADEKLNDKHVTQTSLGACHVPKIGSVFMGDLLRKVGIARKDYSNTMPKSEYTSGKNPLVMNRAKDGFITYIYHMDRTWKLIKNRLQEADLIFKFESCKTTDEIHQFIKEMEFLA